MPVGRTKTILIVDDEADILRMLKYNLEWEGYLVLTASDGNQALSEVQKQPDLVLLDVLLPGIDGLEVARQIKSNKKTSHIAIVFLTALSSESEEIAGFEVGADDYIVKPIRINTLLARIRAVIKRRERISPPKLNNMLRFDNISINIPNYTVSVGNIERNFPKREFEILVYLARHYGRVIPRPTLLNAIWGSDAAVGRRTIDVHVRKIREKLGEHADHIETVKGVGYRLRV
jgi:two-component system alkaline phosphatase synthesis response regulator PhoP